MAEIPFPTRLDIWNPINNGKKTTNLNWWSPDFSHQQHHKGVTSAPRKPVTVHSVSPGLVADAGLAADREERLGTAGLLSLQAGQVDV